MPPPARLTSTENEPDPRMWVQIAAIIRRQINDGTLKPRAPVSITTLAQRYGVTRQTAAKGLSTLEEQGLLKRYPGRGYYVQDTTTPAT